jgi:hypothetical protein
MTTHLPEPDRDDTDDDRTDLQRLSDARRGLRGALLARIVNEANREADRVAAPEVYDD